MRYLSANARLRHIRLTRRRFLRRQKKAIQRKVELRRIDHRFPLKAPTRINLTAGGQQRLVTFVRAIAQKVLREKRQVRLDFHQTESFAPAGTLFLFAEIDRIVELANIAKPISCRSPWRLRPREVLKQIGLFSLTGDNMSVVPRREDVVYWKATKGSDQSGDAFGPMVEHVAAACDKQATEKMEASGLWRGISEAVANTVDHAYHGERGDGFPHCEETKWWMFTQIREGLFTAAVCDLGIGYRRRAPSTIPAWYFDSIAQFLLGQNADAKAIQAAMKYGISSTSLENRGKGSRDALSVLKQHGRGQLMIISNSGSVSYELSKGSEEPIVKTSDLGVESMATIVWWRLPIVEKTT
jgi:hypothetical protein